MFCDSPVSPPVLSPTSPAFTGRSFSVSTTGSPTTPRFAPGHSPPIVEGHDYVWATEKGDDDEGEKVVVRQAKKPRVPEAVGGGRALAPSRAGRPAETAVQYMKQQYMSMKQQEQHF
ncbi:hypothetical protein BGZ95_008960 [Linnemannia exigua]|uniref:Uncharacterized protein n=1 Tax=Linnemannia exigua TaxID=604196 RepID=A0AAD4DDL1_9FUNG|nr:hypothetical protein BGZ95_008960 [Linnemannia exigua]